MRYIKIKSEKYAVNPDKKVVTCIMEYDFKEAFGGFDSVVVVSPWGLDRLMRKLGCKALDAPNKTGYIISCTAKCKRGDEFDETLGRYIAKDKVTLRLLDLDCKIGLKINEAFNDAMKINHQSRLRGLGLYKRILERLRTY